MTANGCVRNRCKPARPHDDEPVAGAQFLDAEQRDDVLQFLVMRDGLADLFGDTIMLLADDGRIEQNR